MSCQAALPETGVCGRHSGSCREGGHCLAEESGEHHLPAPPHHQPPTAVYLHCQVCMYMHVHVYVNMCVTLLPWGRAFAQRVCNFASTVYTYMYDPGQSVSPYYMYSTCICIYIVHVAGPNPSQHKPKNYNVSVCTCTCTCF